MRSLPLIDGCSLDGAGRDGQRARLTMLRTSVVGIERVPDELRVRFGAGVDERVVKEVVAVERGCCSFLDLDYDESVRVLRIGSPDRSDALERFGELFAIQGAT